MNDKHYLLLVFAEGREESIRREYLELLSPEETSGEALERWVISHPSMLTRKRNRTKVAESLRNSPLYVKLCHPSSWLLAGKGGEKG